MEIVEIPANKLNPKEFIRQQVGAISETVGDGVAITALSGGVDSCAVTMLGHRAIGEKLKASKSSVSIMARLLAENGLIERVASSVPRRDYYHFKPGGWILYMKQWLGLMAALHQITERGLGLLADKPDELRQRLQEAHDLFSLVEQKFPALLHSLEKG